jgi:hypothetical protein
MSTPANPSLLPNLPAFFTALFALLLSAPVWAGGGMVLREDKCIIQIGFYEAHFTAYQPQTRGDQQFCQELPDVGETLFVFDYLHGSMKEVPIDFRIIKDGTDLGKYVRMSDIEAIGDLEPLTVFYHEPTVHSDASLSVDHTFAAPGNYIGIVTAGHPTKDTIYSAAFPFTVGKSDYTPPLFYGLSILLMLPVAYHFVWRQRVR